MVKLNCDKLAVFKVVWENDFSIGEFACRHYWINFIYPWKDCWWIWWFWSKNLLKLFLNHQLSKISIIMKRKTLYWMNGFLFNNFQKKAHKEILWIYKKWIALKFLMDSISTELVIGKESIDKKKKKNWLDMMNLSWEWVSVSTELVSFFPLIRQQWYDVVKLHKYNLWRPRLN